jgi:hypothetical protein
MYSFLAILSVLFVCYVEIYRFRISARPKNIEEVDNLASNESLKTTRIFSDSPDRPLELFEIHGLLFNCTYREDEVPREIIEVADCWGKPLFKATLDGKCLRVMQDRLFFGKRSGRNEEWHLKHIFGIARYEATMNRANALRQKEVSQ